MQFKQYISRRVKNKEYIKSQIILPKKLVEQLDWKSGDNLEGKKTPNGLLMYRTDPKEKIKKIDYEQFEKAVISILMSIPNGCLWSELQQKSSLPQKTPSSIWTNRMIHEGKLERHRDPKTSRFIWKLSNECLRNQASRINGWMSPRSG